MEELSDRLMGAIRRKAEGYVTTEEVEEYALIDGEMTMVKRKVTKKEVPADITAARFVLDEEGGDAYSYMTEDELKNERLRLLNLLKEAENATDKNKSQDTMRNGCMS